MARPCASGSTLNIFKHFKNDQDVWFCLKFWAENDCQPWHITNAAKGNASLFGMYGTIIDNCCIWRTNWAHTQLAITRHGGFVKAGSLHFQPRNAPFRGRVIEFNGSTLVYFVFFSGNGGFLKWGYPKSSILTGIFHDKPSILGIPLVRNPQIYLVDPGSLVTPVVL